MKCPYCNKNSLVYVGKSINYTCGDDIDPFYNCERCGARWREITKEVVVKRIRIGDLE